MKTRLKRCLCASGCVAAPLLVVAMVAVALFTVGAPEVRTFAVVGEPPLVLEAVADDTPALQTLVDSSLDVVFPARVCNVRSIRLRSNQTVTIPNGCRLVRIPQPAAQNAILQLTRLQNVKIRGGGTIDGNWAQNRGGQIHGIAVVGCRDVSISDLTIIDISQDGGTPPAGSYGDCVYLGAGPNGAPNEHVRLEGLRLEGCDRHPVFVVSGRGIRIRDCQLLNARGDQPGSGLNLEPNLHGEVIDDILVDGCLIAGCQWGVTSSNHYQNDYTSIRLINCVIERNREEGIHASNLGEGFLVHGCRITDNGRTGLRLSGTRRPQIAYSIFRRNGLNPSNSERDGIKLLQGCTYWSIDHCDLSQNYGNGANIAMSSTSSATWHRATFDHNIVEANRVMGLWLHETSGGRVLDVQVANNYFALNGQYGVRAIGTSDAGNCRGVSFVDNRWYGNGAGELDGARNHYRTELRIDPRTLNTERWTNGAMVP